MDSAEKVIHDAIYRNSTLDTPDTEEATEAVVAALGANGYVVVPKPLLDELLAASSVVGTRASLDVQKRILSARAAVVEAVGPTREDAT